MIVVDTNVIAYLLISGTRTSQAKKALGKDHEWAAPLLWRSEFRSILTLYLRRGHLTLDQALRFMHEAEGLMRGNEFEVPSSQVLALTAGSHCSAYDCEFVALAQELGVILVTSDAEIVKEFPSTSVSLNKYVSK